MDARYPLADRPLPDIATALDVDDREAVLDAVDTYDVELDDNLSRSRLKTALADGTVPIGCYADQVTSPLQTAALQHEQDTGDVPDWAVAVNYRDLPGFGPVREVDDWWSAKATYVDVPGDEAVQIPTLKRTFKERLEHVLTLQHNAEQIQNAGLTPSGAYDDIRAAEIEDETLPYAVIPYRSEMYTYDDLPPDMQADWYDRFNDVAETMNELVAAGTVAASVPNDYWLGGTPSGNLQYDADANEVVVVDVGELHDGAWDDYDIFPYDTRGEFLQEHGIDAQVDAVLDEMDI